MSLLLRRPMAFHPLTGLVVAACLLSLGSAAEAAATFAPHRAIYDLSLNKARSGGDITQARGRLEFEWADVCSGWTVSQRTHVRLTSGEGQVIDFGWTLNAIESKDGQRYRFFIRRLTAGQPIEVLRGEARLHAPGAAGLAVFSEPEGRKVSLPEGTLFPTAHTLRVIESAERGDLPLWRLVFDGSGDEAIFGVNVVRSRTLPPDADVQLDSELLRGQKSWRLNLAYFGMDAPDATPQHEQELRLFANGVVDEMLLDYGDFALLANLASLEALPDPGCEPE